MAAWNAARGPIRAQWTRTGVIGGREGAVLTRGYIKGGPQLAAKLRDLEQGLKDELLAQATKAGADVLAEAWRQMVRSSIGIGPGSMHYAEAIEAQAKPGRVGATGLVQVRKMADTADEAQPRRYAARWEFGSAYGSKAAFKSGTAGASRVRQAKPTLRPAFDSVKGQMLDAMGDEVKRLIERAV